MTFIAKIMKKTDMFIGGRGSGKFVLLFIQLHFLTACAGTQMTPSVALSEDISTPSLIKNEMTRPEPELQPLKTRSIHINGKKFLRYQAARPWHLFDTELSQYVIATNVLVLSCKDLPEALATAGLDGTLKKWQQIAFNTYQASFDMQLIEQHYRRLHNAGLVVEWQLDYSVQRTAAEM